MKNKIVITVISVSLIFGFLALAYKLTNAPQVTNFPQVNVLDSTDHIKWSPDKKNLLVEYSDFECSACQSFHNLIKSQIESPQSKNYDLTKKITLVYRHFPLYQIHPYTQDASYAAEAAGKQGKFFEMIDLIFTRQNDWVKKGNVKAEFEKYAGELKLNADQFKKNRDSKDVKDKVAGDTLSGEKVGISATPTFFINGKKIENLNSFDDFVAVLRESLIK
jgi:protein-disulfide isomerase